MAIIDIFNVDEKEVVGEGMRDVTFSTVFSSFCVRVFFFFLFLVDITWFAYQLVKLLLLVGMFLGSLGSLKFLKGRLLRGCLALKRALVCGLACFLSLISPSFGIMIACTYFLMYDKKGIDEVVPSALQEQFKGLFSQVSEKTV